MDTMIRDIDTVDFCIGDWNYMIVENCTKKYVTELNIVAKKGTSKLVAKEPVRVIAKDKLDGLIKAYTKVVETTVCSCEQQMHFVMKIGEILANLKQIKKEVTAAYCDAMDDDLDPRN